MRTPARSLRPRSRCPGNAPGALPETLMKQFLANLIASLDDLLLGAILLASLALSLLSAGHALLMKRDPRSALGWIVACLTIPLIGPFVYWTMGINRIHRKARQWLESGRLLAGWDNFPVRPEEQASLSLPSHAEHLLELRALADRVVSSEVLRGNRLTPLRNGEEAYPAMLE